ncbi:MAG: nitroreductase family protein [Bacillota bacterium]
MNDTIRSIINRRSIRMFEPEQIRDNELEAVLQAGAYAPSAANQQPWHFTVIQNKDVMKRITQDTKDYFMFSENLRFKQIADDPSFNPFHGAPTCIVISGDEKALMPHADCAAAAQNMLIAASSLGLGSCWVNIFLHLFNGSKGEAWKSELDIPTGYKPFYSIVLGYKTTIGNPEPLPRRNNIVNYIK